MDDFFKEAYNEGQGVAVEEPKQEETSTATETPITETEQGTEVQADSTDGKIVVDGLGEFTLDELREMKNGYMRQSDYTKKTQELARMRKELEEMNAQPRTQDAVQPQVQLNPYEQRLVELEQRIADKELDEKITELKTKYPDFDEVQVLNTAYERGITDLEMVYKSLAPAPNLDAIKEQLRAEIMREIQENRTATSTIVTSGGEAVQQNPPQYSERERYIAESMGMTVEEYLKYK